jgi:hypothetical protein
VLISGAGMFGVFLFLTYYLQLHLEFSPTKSGVAFLPMVGALMVTAQLGTTVLLPRLGPKTVIPLGLAVATAGMAWLTGIGVGSSYASAATDYLAGKDPSSRLVQAQATLESYTTAFWWSAGFFAAGALITLVLHRRGVPEQDAGAAPVVHM